MGAYSWGIIIASSSQSTALQMQGSYPAGSDPIPTRSVSATQSSTTCQRYNRKDERAREKSYASVSFYANELVLERCVRRQVHRRAPHGVIRRIQRDLYSQVWVSNHRPHFLIIDKHTHRVGRIPITKLRRTAHHENILPKPISA